MNLSKEFNLTYALQFHFLIKCKIDLLSNIRMNFNGIICYTDYLQSIN